MTVESNDRDPYVISADVYGLLKKWVFGTCYSIPTQSYFIGMADNLANVLQGYFGGTIDVVKESELSVGINHLAVESPYPIVSVDRVYLHRPSLRNFAGSIDMTRVVDESFQDVSGICPRPGFPEISQQLERLRLTTESPVTLVDDVVFSGEGAVNLSKMLKEVNRPVRQVICGVGIAEGVEKLQALDIEVRCVREYHSVIDEICERDFFACVPLSGRTVIDKDGKNWGAPYFSPFGNSQRWASVPEEFTEEFSEFCLSQSIALWKKIEKLSKVNVPTYAVPRKIRGLKKDTSVARALLEYTKAYTKASDNRYAA